MGDDRADTKFVQNYRNCEKNGIPWGAYHFYSFREGSKKQIANIISKVPNSFNLPIVLDTEFTETGTNRKLQINLSKAFNQGFRQGKTRGTEQTYKDYARREIYNILKGLEKHYGKKPIIYCTINFFELIIKDHKPFNPYKLWISAVTRTWQQVSSQVGSDRLVCHQIKGDHEGATRGKWSGIAGLVDINKAHGKFW